MSGVPSAASVGWEAMPSARDVGRRDGRAEHRMLVRVVRQAALVPLRRTPGRPEEVSGASPPAGPNSDGSGPAAETGSTVTASWMVRPSSAESAWVTSARSRVSSCSLTNSFGVAISAVFSTSPSGLVSLSHARWCGLICRSARPSRERAHTSARSVSLTARSPRARRTYIPQVYPQVVHVALPLRPVTIASCAA